jgi:hypothetical protein
MERMPDEITVSGSFITCKGAFSLRAFREFSSGIY